MLRSHRFRCNASFFFLILVAGQNTLYLFSLLQAYFQSEILWIYIKWERDAALLSLINFSFRLNFSAIAMVNRSHNDQIHRAKNRSLWMHMEYTCIWRLYGSKRSLPSLCWISIAHCEFSFLFVLCSAFSSLILIRFYLSTLKSTYKCVLVRNWKVVFEIVNYLTWKSELGLYYSACVWSRVWKRTKAMNNCNTM